MPIHAAGSVVTYPTETKGPDREPRIDKWDSSQSNRGTLRSGVPSSGKGLGGGPRHIHPKKLNLSEDPPLQPKHPALLLINGQALDFAGRQEG